MADPEPGGIDGVERPPFLRRGFFLARTSPFRRARRPPAIRTLIRPSRARTVPSAFFAYASQPEHRRETLATSADMIASSGQVHTRTWEQLGNPGRLAITEILRAIDAADVLVCETTDLNQNVLFELGYAIGRERRVWLVRDESDEAAARAWKRFGLLRGVIYLPFTNSEQIREGFLKERPDRQSETLFTDLIAPSLAASTPTSLFYFKSLYDTNPSQSMTRMTQEVLDGRTVVTVDPIEGSFKPLSWYALELFNTRGAMIHFSGEGRTGAAPHNARCAFVAGLAHGFGKPLLMLAEDGYDPPFDYRELLYVYRNAKDAARKTADWLSSSLSVPRSRPLIDPSRVPPTTSELKGLLLGSYIAEDEQATLDEYFIETRNYLEIIAGGTTVFVGRKGTGKTANFLQAAQKLSSDRRNLVCAIKPPGYEFKEVVRLLVGLRERDQKGYLVQSLWKYLLFTEIARSAVDDIRSRLAVPDPDSPEGRLLTMAEDPDGILHEEFAVRLERGIARLNDADTPPGVEARRTAISEALHAGPLKELREILGHVLSTKQRIAILVDNLDKGWERDADLVSLSAFLLGLLSAIGDVVNEFGRQDRWRRAADVSLAVFLRSDIYSTVTKEARERDKLPASEISWADQELLLRVIEDRFIASKGGQGARHEIWTRYFVPTVHGIPTKAWLMNVVLPRPRDLVYLCNAAITNAINRGHKFVEQADLLSAEADYSHFALDSIVVEGEVTVPRIEDVLYEFVGATALLSESDVRARIDGIRTAKQKTDEIIEFLTQVAFLGPQVGLDQYAFLERLDDARRLDALARRVAALKGRPGRSFVIHPAFWSYLEVEPPDSRPTIRT